MSKTVWVGSRQSDIKYAGNFFNSSLTLYGDNLCRNYALCKIHNRRIGSNAQSDLRDNFVLEYVQKLIREDETVRFMFYDPVWIMEIKELQQFKNHFICLNDFEFLETIRNKIAFRKMVSEQGQFNLIKYCVVDSKDLSKEVFCRLFAKFGDSLIFQKEIASGGSGTFLVKKTTTTICS